MVVAPMHTVLEKYARRGVKTEPEAFRAVAVKESQTRGHPPEKVGLLAVKRNRHGFSVYFGSSPGDDTSGEVAGDKYLKRRFGVVSGDCPLLGAD